MNYPDWVPDYVQRLDRIEFGERDELEIGDEVLGNKPDPEEAHAINRLATDPRLEKAWTAINKRLSKDHPDEQLKEFVETISKGLKEPSKFWDMTSRSERDRELKSVISTINKLSKLLKGIDLPPRIFNIYCEVAVKGSDGEYVNDTYKRIDTETHLKELKNHIEDLVGARSYLTKAPSKNSKMNAKQICFTRRLQQFFMDQFGTPLDETVIVIAEAFFEGIDITRDDIRTKRKSGTFPTEQENDKREGYLEWHDDTYSALFGEED